MRSWFSPPNHSSPCLVTHTEPAACTWRACASRAVTISSISPGCVSFTSQLTMPRASLVPVHTVPRSRVSVRLS